MHNAILPHCMLVHVTTVAQGTRLAERLNSSVVLVTTHHILLENVEHCGGEPEQAANMHKNRLSFTLK